MESSGILESKKRVIVSYVSHATIYALISAIGRGT